MSAKLKSFWCTRGEVVETEVDGVKVSRDIKIGMTVESDNDADRSEDLHLAAMKSLNAAFEREREEWLSTAAMKVEADRIRKLKENKEDEQQ